VSSLLRTVPSILVGATDEDYLLAKPIFLMFLGRFLFLWAELNKTSSAKLAINYLLD
jgi:hypothetical protein